MRIEISELFSRNYCNSGQIASIGKYCFSSNDPTRVSNWQVCRSRRRRRVIFIELGEFTLIDLDLRKSKFSTVKTRRNRIPLLLANVKLLSTGLVCVNHSLAMFFRLLIRLTSASHSVDYCRYCKRLSVVQSQRHKH